ncbi:hypothetical protein MOQ72_35325 [Saccharopolyspora sp. K220]|uniref:hypothetical protein n=1 Tax=Saccharopolyspora soli TaxID=2926618 RepID=UPI001F599A90|nr:hypothetical protein [Saccharopolyspora soli]MCI2422710.1 hypothetical protein [Saccharopolyspora soli]
MDAFWVPVMTVVVLGFVLGSIGWLATRMRRRRVGGSTMGPFDELWHPAAHRARIEFEVQTQRQEPMPSPDDPPDPGEK